MYYLTVNSEFSAAHHLESYKGKCAAVHGHNWKVEITLEGAVLDDAGMIGDFGSFRAALKELLQELDHKDLNTVEFLKGLNPTCENVARRIFEEMGPRIDTERYRLIKVSVWEKDGNKVSYGCKQGEG